MWLLAATALAADLSLTADRVVIDDGRIVADGHVVVRIDGVTVTATAAEATDAGVWLTDATLQRPDGGTITAAHAELRPGPTLAGDGVRYDPCGCSPSPWTVTARSVQVDDDAVRARNATLRVFGVPIAWVPAATVPLTRRSGLLAPDLGAGADGVRATLPLYLTLGPSADLTLTPEVRTARGGQLHAEGRYALRSGGGTVTAALGPDWQTGTWRGGAAFDHAAYGPGWRTAAFGALTSDAAWRGDWATGWLDRGRPFEEARGLVGVRRLEGSVDLFQHAGVVDHPLAAVGWRAPAADLPLGLVGSASAVAGVVVRGESAWDPTAAWVRTEAQAALSRPFALGPVRATVTARGRAADTGDATGGYTPSGRGQARVDLALPVWRAGETSFTRVEPRLGLVTGTREPWTLAPGVVVRHMGPGVAELSVMSRLSDGRWGGSATAWLQRGPWEALGQVDVRSGRVPLAAVLAAWRPAGGRLSVGVTHLRPNDLVTGAAEADLPGPLRPIRLGVSAAIDREVGWWHRGAAVTYTHPSGCVQLGVDARLDADRGAPDVGVRIEVVPR